MTKSRRSGPIRARPTALEPQDEAQDQERSARARTTRALRRPSSARASKAGGEGLAAEEGHADRRRHHRVAGRGARGGGGDDAGLEPGARSSSTTVPQGPFSVRVTPPGKTYDGDKAIALDPGDYSIDVLADEAEGLRAEDPNLSRGAGENRAIKVTLKPSVPRAATAPMRRPEDRRAEGRARRRRRTAGQGDPRRRATRLRRSQARRPTATRQGSGQDAGQAPPPDKAAPDARQDGRRATRQRLRTKRRTEAPPPDKAMPRGRANDIHGALHVRRAGRRGHDRR